MSTPFRTGLKAAVLFFPVARAYFDRRAGVQPFKRQTFQFLVSLLVETKKPLNVRFNSEPFGFRFLAESRFQVGMDGDAHLRVCAGLGSSFFIVYSLLESR
jgi:hypothetical protein